MRASPAKAPVPGDWPADGLERVRACPVCGETGRHVLYEGLTDRVFFSAPGVWTLVACEGCESAYLDPRPTPEALPLAYQNYFTHEAPTLPAGTETLAWARRLKRTLANGYRNRRFGAHFHPASPLGVGVAWIPGQRVKLEGALRYLPRVIPGGVVLDVGCGNGDFLNRARAIDWTVVGCEPDPEARAAARALGLDVRAGGIEGLMGEAGCFDVITLNHVIEHVPDPRHTLECVFALLKPGGRLYLETPNIQSDGHRRFGRSWRGLEPPRHLVLMNWAALERLLGESGFGLIEHHASANVYPNLAASSRAIEFGEDSREAQPRAGDYWRSYGLGVKLLWDDRASEFVTLVAHKPMTES